MENVTGLGEADPAGVDAILEAELSAAGIKVYKFPEGLRNNGGEPKSIIRGEIGPWGFKRAWVYWVAEGPGLPISVSEALYASHGKYVRCNGSCTAPSPKESGGGFAIGMYHVDTPEGLKALVDAIKGVIGSRVGG